ncbi:hypothetical protein SEUCBS140593_000335 [Sporothrix eucalyptigena]|uniref:Flavin reductase like domain-containing protein n=1 Tax=Sporothrix eucalyptigena TaxID=1812306 RepID=A0ABP0ANZ4_9PEZI
MGSVNGKDAATAALAERTAHESSIKRNPHPDFKGVENSRPDWEENASWHYTKTRQPGWKWGQGGNDGGASLEKSHVEIDPHEPGRPPAFNYKLLISAIIPRPIGFLSTLSADGTSSNLAPFSYTNMVNHDPPIFAIGITGGIANAKDTLANIASSKECVLNIISEHFVEAANSTSVNAPYGTSEWGLSGLHQAPSTHVKPARVKEAIFSVECKLMELKEFDSRANPGKKSGTLMLLEGVNFWARDDAINDEKNIIDPEARYFGLSSFRIKSRLGGVTYGRLTEGFEILRPDFSSVNEAENSRELLEKASKP